MDNTCTCIRQEPTVLAVDAGEVNRAFLLSPFLPLSGGRFDINSNTVSKNS